MGGPVTLHLWGVSSMRVPQALGRMATDRLALRTLPGLRFGKLLGTGSGRTFDVRDADLGHWGLLAVWDSPATAVAFERSRVCRGWDRIAHERLRVAMSPVSSTGRWSGQEPFAAVPVRHDGRTAALTRARLVPRKALTFWRAVPPVAAALHAAPGVELAVGVGEAPIGLQGTFSVWSTASALRDFAYADADHVTAIRRTAEERWYGEELFARFAVHGVDGTYRSRTIGSA